MVKEKLDTDTVENVKKVQVDSDSWQISSVTMSGSAISSLDIPSNGNKTLKVNVSSSDPNSESKYYGLVQGAWYKMKLTNSKLELEGNAKTEADIEAENQGTGSYYISAAFTPDASAGLTVGDASDDDEITIQGQGNEKLGSGILKISLRNRF